MRIITLRHALQHANVKCLNSERSAMQTQEIMDAMVRTNTDEIMFFRLAHLHCFNRDVDVYNDVAQFKMHAVIPPYVLRYARHVFETDI